MDTQYSRFVGTEDPKDDFKKQFKLTSARVNFQGTVADESSYEGSERPLSDEDYVSGAAIPHKAKSMSQLLEFTTVENVLGNGANFTEEDTVESALKTFKELEVQGAPVYDTNGKFLRILSISDIFDCFCSVQHENLDFFFKQSIKTIADLTSSNTPMTPIGTPLSEVIRTLATGAHHVGVLDNFSRSLFNIISQLSVVRFIAKHISLIPRELRQLPVSNFMKQIVSVNTIPSDTSTREAFDYLFKGNISAAAVVNLDGRIVDTVSTTDLVGVVCDHFEHINLPIVNFLQATRRTKAVKPPISCRLEDTFEYVILKLASTGVHRLWVVDSGTQQFYLGLVNLTNVLEFVSKYLID